MPWSHHSHSGQFCAHAVSTLEDVVQTAVAKGMTTFCLTEHIPRHRCDFYPEEEKDQTEETLWNLYDSFYHEARRLQEKYTDRIQLFVGFEGEWIREGSLGIIQTLLGKYPVDLFLGSVHHTHAWPIDYDTAMYHKAKDAAGGTDEAVFEDYFDEHYAMLQALRPIIVAHFDLIRLKSDEPDTSFKAFPKVWEKVERNLKYVAEYGGVLEINSSALRKGMDEAYPQVEICQTFRGLGGRFTLSDDSHGVEQVGLHYERALECVERAGITELVHVVPASESAPSFDTRFPGVAWATVSLSELKKHPFWSR